MAHVEQIHGASDYAALMLYAFRSWVNRERSCNWRAEIALYAVFRVDHRTIFCRFASP